MFTFSGNLSGATATILRCCKGILGGCLQAQVKKVYPQVSIVPKLPNFGPSFNASLWDFFF